MRDRLLREPGDLPHRRFLVYSELVDQVRRFVRDLARRQLHGDLARLDDDSDGS